MNRELKLEIQSVVRAKILSDEPFRPDVLVHEIVSSHPDVHGRDAEWHTKNSFDNVAEGVRKLTRDTKLGDTESSIQPYLSGLGLEKIQASYVIQRNGEAWCVPLIQMTDAEILAKAEEHLSQAAGHKQHADELIRFAALRKSFNPAQAAG